MKVSELIELFKKQNQDAIVYHDYDGDIALMVTDVSPNAVGSQEETVLLS
jgi:hypothetical protein